MDWTEQNGIWERKANGYTLKVWRVRDWHYALFLDGIQYDEGRALTMHVAMNAAEREAFI